MASRSEIEWQPAWQASVEDHDAEHMFLEDREDVRLVLDATAEAASIHSTRSVGLAVQPRGAGHTAPAMTFRSLSGPRQPLPRSTWDEVPRAREMLEELVRAASDRRRGTQAAASWVGFDQSVAIVRRGETARTDRRRGARIKLTVLARSRDHTGVAVEERVLGRFGSCGGAISELLRAIQRAEVRLDAGSRPPVDVPVVFAPGVGGILIHELVGHALEGDIVLDARSWLSRWHEQGGRADRLVRVLDDPRRSRAAWRIDDDGDETHATPLIREGRVVGVLHDRHTAARARLDSSGHGRRASYRDPVRPRMGCTFLANGPHDPGEVLEGITDGVYVRRMEAASTDVERGQATFRVTDADRVLNGKIDRPIEPHLMFVDGAHALATLDRVADDLCFDRCIGSCVKSGQSLPVSVGAPTIRVRMISASPEERLK